MSLREAGVHRRTAPDMVTAGTKIAYRDLRIVRACSDKAAILESDQAASWSWIGGMLPPSERTERATKSGLPQVKTKTVAIMMLLRKEKGSTSARTRKCR